jgi:hypothetical protein
MEAEMSYQDDRNLREIRQDLLEEFSGAISGYSCAPLPGSLLDMLESIGPEDDGPTVHVSLAAPPPPLTGRQKDGRMNVCRRIFEAIFDAAGRFIATTASRRLHI